MKCSQQMMMMMMMEMAGDEDAYDDGNADDEYPTTRAMTIFSREVHTHTPPKHIVYEILLVGVEIGCDSSQGSVMAPIHKNLWSPWMLAVGEG